MIVLDVMLPKKDGFSVAADLRRAGVSTPVLLLTARDAVPDKITGLDSGADDYMTKPFSPAELLAHLRALTRRQARCCSRSCPRATSSSIWKPRPHVQREVHPP